jgi:PTH1 family peptidyl-tRNA hydrolase
VEENLRSSLFLIVGLGNPGRGYKGNRHNVGFMLVDKLASHLGVTFRRMESQALVTKVDYLEKRVFLAKPQTYMNSSGQSVSSLVRFYKVPFANLLVVYDDVDLPIGTLRMRPSGGTGGHKGVESILASLGTQEFPRLRLGIGRPPGRMEAADYVLHDFSRVELETLPTILDQGVEAVLTYVTEGLETAMTRYNAQVFNEESD